MNSLYVNLFCLILIVISIGVVVLRMNMRLDAIDRGQDALVIGMSWDPRPYYDLLSAFFLDLHCKNHVYRYVPCIRIDTNPAGLTLHFDPIRVHQTVEVTHSVVSFYKQAMPTVNVPGKIKFAMDGDTFCMEYLIAWTDLVVCRQLKAAEEDEIA